MNAAPAVSVVIATYNYGRFLAGAIDSALAQTFPDLEVIVVDDGSTDDTREVVAAYAGDSRLLYERTDHLGQPGAKNTGIRLARGRYVAFLDADDLWLPTKLEKQVVLFERDPELAVVYGRWLAMDEQGRDIPDWARPVHRGFVLPQVFRQSFICFSSSVVRADVLREVKGFDEGLPLSIDYDLWLRIALKYRFDYVDEPVVRYRTGHANLSKRQQERLDCIARIMQRFLDEYGGRAALAPGLVRAAEAEHRCDKAWTARAASKPQALYWYLSALSVCPWHSGAWRGLLTSWWPDRWKSIARRALSTAADGRRPGGQVTGGLYARR